MLIWDYYPAQFVLFGARFTRSPVEVEGVGTVTDDLWLPADLKVIRPKQATA